MPYRSSSRWPVRASQACMTGTGMAALPLMVRRRRAAAAALLARASALTPSSFFIMRTYMVGTPMNTVTGG